MSLPLRIALGIVLALGFAKVSTALIAPPWGLVCSFVGGISLGFLFARAK